MPTFPRLLRMPTMAAVAHVCVALACASEPEVVPGPVAQVCEALQGEVSSAITLGPSFATAVALPVGEARGSLSPVEAVLQDGSTGNGGHGRFDVPEAGEWLVLHSEAVAMKLYGPDGVLIAAESSVKQPPECTAAAKVVTYRLGAGQHTVEFGPTPLPVFDVVVALAPD
jgi:hypothetical protein